MRIIDADELKALRELYIQGKLQFIENEYDLIDKCPTIDAEPVRHGRWVYDPNGMDFNLGAWVCSECRERNNNLGCMRRINPYQFVGSRFCPNCGAKMDLKE